MMNRSRILLVIAALFMLQTSSWGQASAHEGLTKYGKTEKIAAVIDFPYSDAVIKTAIADVMQKKGIKAENAKAATIYRNARISLDQQELNDLHFVIGKTNKKSGTTKVALLVARPGENVALRTDTDRYKLEEGKNFLHSIIPEIEKHNLEAQIKQQETAILKMEKEIQKNVNEQKNYQKRIEDYQKRLEESIKAGAAKNDALKTQKEVLEAMKKRRQ